MLRIALLSLFAFTLFAFTTGHCLAGERVSFHHENVLGTSLEIKVIAASQTVAKQAEEQVLAEIDRLSLIYSTWDSKSEMRRWMDQDSVDSKVSKELIELFRMCEDRWTATDGAFDPRVGHAIELWKKAAKDSKAPSASELASAVSSIKEQAWRIDAQNQSIRRTAKAPLTFDGIAKGLIVDRACDAAMKVSGIDGVLINIGGDLRLCGSFADEVTISDPKSPAKALAKVALENRAIATSGNYQHGFKIGDQSYSHIFDPRTAKPVDHVISSSVIAESAAIADAMATAFSVLTVARSLEICNDQPQLACLLVTSDGKTHMSNNWPKEESESTASGSTTASKGPAESWATGAELLVDFEIHRADGRRYRRPYLAVWIEDKNQAPVRTLTLWLQAENPGPRWHRDLKRWYKQNGSRKLANGSNLIGTVSAATKPPGAYKTLWDGKDDNGKMVKQGKYTLYLEVAREHGTYQLMSKEIVIGDKPVSGELGENAEIKSVHFEYQPKGSGK